MHRIGCVHVTPGDPGTRHWWVNSYDLRGRWVSAVMCPNKTDALRLAASKRRRSRPVFRRRNELQGDG